MLSLEEVTTERSFPWEVGIDSGVVEKAAEGDATGDFQREEQQHR
jgi:hypothetical protein